MVPVAGHLTAAGHTLPKTPHPPLDDVAAQDRTPQAADGQSADRSGSLQLSLLFLKAGPAARLRHDGHRATGLTVRSIGSLHGQAVCDHATCGG
jgi:hypothetical protein